MRKEVIEIGKTVEAAIDAACEKQGWSRDDIEWEIVDLPKKGFLGLKNFPAKVKVSKEVPDEKPVAKSAPTPTSNTLKTEKKPQLVEQENKPVSKEGFDLKVKTAQEYVSGILRDLGLTADLQCELTDNGLHIKIEGSGLGMIIGRRGETLDSIQYLTGLVANRQEGDYLRITVDCGDYRIKRKATLESLAKKLSAQVLKTNTSKVLEPMNPFERRIIHATVSEIEGVSSTSIGEEPNRRVIINTPTSRTRGPRRDSRGGSSREGGSRGGRRMPPRTGGRDSGGYRRDNRDSRGGDRDRGRDRDRRPAPVTQPQGEIKQTTEAKDKPLYSKIDLD